MTFQLPYPLPPGAEALLRQACFAGGYDQTPVPTQVAIEDGRLVVTRGMNESGYLLVPWSVGSLGTFITSTATLRERAEPFRLMVELARGKLNQVRTQLAEWQDIGLQSTPELDRDLAETARLFARAAVDQPQCNESSGVGGHADEVAASVLARSYDMAERLVQLYVEQMYGTRLSEDGKLITRLASRFKNAPSGDHANEYLSAFNAAQIGLRWRDVEPVESQYEWGSLDEAIAFARNAGLPITIGPVIDMTSGMLPDWASGWNGDLPTLAAFMCDFLETVIGRYKSDVRRWVVCAGFNHTDGLGLTDDDRLRLAARLFEAATQLDPELELVVSVAQPWGDYLVNEDQTISPLAFADDLLRAGLKISAVELEIRPALLPRGSLPRDLLDTARLLDLFGHLQIPLEVVLSHPASLRSDSRAEHQQHLWTAAWHGVPTPEGQAKWGSAFANLALCTPHVQAVTWDHWNDGDSHLTPMGGLIDAGCRAYPLLNLLRAIRATYLT